MSEDRNRKQNNKINQINSFEEHFDQSLIDHRRNNMLSRIRREVAAFDEIIKLLGCVKGKVSLLKSSKEKIPL